jgi:EPS-associated MarR family transcriptional regulator
MRSFVNGPDAPSFPGQGRNADRSDSLPDDMRFKVLRLVEQHPDYSQRDLAIALGISLGGLNYCLRALIQKGHIKVSNFRRSDRKLRYAYALTPKGVAERAKLAGGFLKRKKSEYELLLAEIYALVAVGADHSPSPADSE